ncbi:MAG: HK97 family phage prohead protease [Lewinellaceae bacterium]|nr:HK97 family phage prohead protease [Lewinellaceae bacterium]
MSAGLKYKFEAPNTSLGNDLLESIRRGDVSQSSFGFTVADAKWEDLEMMKDGKKWFKTKRTILKLERLYDVSPSPSGLPGYRWRSAVLSAKS